MKTADSRTMQYTKVLATAPILHSLLWSFFVPHYENTNKWNIKRDKDAAPRGLDRDSKGSEWKRWSRCIRTKNERRRQQPDILELYKELPGRHRKKEQNATASTATTRTAKFILTFDFLLVEHTPRPKQGGSGVHWQMIPLSGKVAPSREYRVSQTCIKNELNSWLSQRQRWRKLPEFNLYLALWICR